MYGIINGKRVEGSSLAIIRSNAKKLGSGTLKVCSEATEKRRVRRVKGANSWALKKSKTTKADKAQVVVNPVIAVFRV